MSAHMSGMSPRLAPARPHLPGATASTSSTQQSPADATGSSLASPARPEATPKQLATYARVRELIAQAKAADLGETWGDYLDVETPLQDAIQALVGDPEQLALQKGIPEFRSTINQLAQAFFDPAVVDKVPLDLTLARASQLVDLMPVDFVPAMTLLLDKALRKPCTPQERNRAEFTARMGTYLKFAMRLLQRWPDHGLARELAQRLADQLPIHGAGNVLFCQAVRTAASLPQGWHKQVLLGPWLNKLIDIVGQTANAHSLWTAYCVAQGMGDRGQGAMAYLTETVSTKIESHLQSSDGVFAKAPFFQQLLACDALLADRERLVRALTSKCMAPRFWSREFLDTQDPVARLQFLELCAALAKQQGAAPSPIQPGPDTLQRVSRLLQNVHRTANRGTH